MLKQTILNTIGSTALLVCISLSSVIPAYALEGPNPIASEVKTEQCQKSDSLVVPRYDAVLEMSTKLSINAAGYASCGGTADVRSGYTCNVTLWLLLYYWLIWSLWTYAFTLGINLVAIYLGSSGGFVLLASLQVVCISLLITLQAFESNKGLLAILQRANPITCLILCWQTSKLFDRRGELYLEDSLLLVLVLATTVTVVGGLIVQRHDLLISDTDGG